MKTDRRDAQALMDACRLGAYRGGAPHLRTPATRANPGDNLVRTPVRQVQVVRALLRREGLRVRSGQASSFGKRMDEVETLQWSLDIIAPVRAVMDSVSREMLLVERAIEQIVNGDPVVQRLCTAPGIGPVTVVAFVPTLDLVQWFEGAHQVQAYLGLLPSEFSSGERQQRGAITRTGNTPLRWLLVEAAWLILRSRHSRTAELRLWAQRIALRRGQRIAIVALARKLAGILFAIWRDETEFGKAERRSRRSADAA